MGKIPEARSMSSELLLPKRNKSQKPVKRNQCGQESCERITYGFKGGAETVIAEKCAHDGIEEQNDDVEVCPGLVGGQGSRSFVECVIVEFHVCKREDWKTVDESRLDLSRAGLAGLSRLGKDTALHGSIENAAARQWIMAPAW